MKKIILSIAAFALLTTAVQAQVKYKLTRQADNVTYVVSLVPDVTWTFPQNVTTTAQIAIKLPSAAHFIAGRITSLVADTKWVDNAYVEAPTGDKNFNYVLFNLQTVGTKAFTFEPNREVPLFSFQNIGTTCFGAVELVDNNSATTKAVIANGFNVGQHIATLGSNGEAYTGIEGSTTALCAGVTGTQDLDNTPLSISRAFPTPANTEVNVEWQLAGTDVIYNVSTLKLDVTNALGETVYSIGLTASKGLQKQQLDVKSYAEGMYFLRLTSDKGVSKTKTFVVVH